MRLARLAARCALGAILASTPAAAQQGAIVRGTILDSVSHRGVPGAQVTVVGTALGTVTNDAGVYTLRGVPVGAATVRVQRIGYAAQDRRVAVAAGDATTADVTLLPVATTLSTVVATGYGTSARAEVSSAIASIDSTAIAAIPVVAIDNVIQGKIAGVQVMQNSGEPGSGVSVRVRGPASLNAGNQPLYVVDGVPVIQGSFQQMAPSGQDIVALTGLNPDEIASIDVLKDAAAAAIYGSRGSNGVVIITTKRGQASPVRFTFNSYYGSQNVERKIGLLNAHDYVTLMNESRTIEGRAALFAAGTDSIDVDWQDAIFRQAPVADFQLGMSGGSDRVKFLLSGAHFDQRGIVIGSGYQRQALRFNADAVASNRLVVSSSVSLTREDNDRVPGDLNLDGVVTNAVAMQPFTPVYGSSFGFGGTRENLLYSNPVAVAAYNTTNAKTLRALGNLEAKLTLAERLTLTGRAGADVYGLDELRWRSPKVDKATGASVGGEGASGHTEANRYVLEAFANYDAAFGDGMRLGVTGGSSVEYNHTELNFVRGQGFPTGFETYVRNAASPSLIDGSATENNLLSFFTRATWSMRDRYFASASLRADGSSRFGSANRYGVFPAVSLGWVVSEESFASGLARWGTLKLRGSYGTTGNQGIGDFASRTLAAANPYSGAAGLAGSQLGNPNLKWEQTRETDVGVDLTVLDGRLGVIADWYYRNTSNLLVSRPVPSTSGYTSVWDNVGVISNRGLDLALQTVNLKARDGARWSFGWTSDLNVTWNRNKVDSLYGGLPITGTVSSRVTSVAAVGQPLGTFYLYKFLRVDPQTGNAIFENAAGGETMAPVSADLKYVGNPQPDYYGGFTNRFTLGDFDLRAFVQYSQGNEVLNQMRIFMDDGGNSRDNKTVRVLQRWQKPGDVTDQPRMGVQSGARISNASRFVEDGSFVRLGEVTLGWRVPARASRAIRLQSTRVYVSGRNLHTWTKYSGYNPDVNSNGSTANLVMGVDYYAYPLARTVTAGVSAGW